MANMKNEIVDVATHLLRDGRRFELHNCGTMAEPNYVIFASPYGDDAPLNEITAMAGLGVSRTTTPDTGFMICDNAGKTLVELDRSNWRYDDLSAAFSERLSNLSK